MAKFLGVLEHLPKAESDLLSLCRSRKALHFRHYEGASGGHPARVEQRHFRGLEYGYIAEMVPETRPSPFVGERSAVQLV